MSSFDKYIDFKKGVGAPKLLDAYKRKKGRRGIGVPPTARVIAYGVETRRRM